MNNTRKNIINLGNCIRRKMQDISQKRSVPWLPNFKNGCFIASKLLANNYKNASFVFGEMIIKKSNPNSLEDLRTYGAHAWVEICDLVIDITAQQYEDELPGSFKPTNIINKHVAYNTSQQYVYVPILYNDSAWSFLKKHQQEFASELLIKEITRML